MSIVAPNCCQRAVLHKRSICIPPGVMLILTPRSIARMFFFVHPFFALPVLLREAVILCDGVILSAAKNLREAVMPRCAQNLREVVILSAAKNLSSATRRFFAVLRMTGNAQILRCAQNDRQRADSSLRSE